MILADEAATRAVGAALAPSLRAGDVILLDGSLGAGKTTLVRGLLEALGHHGEVPSPSFAIVQPYDELALPLWHVDLYRIAHPSELDELGLDGVLGDGVLVVEWPDHAGEGAWPITALALSLAPDEDGARVLTATPGQGWEGRWPPQ
ncbi:MAG: tRNA (adenosine(37)-N6)-threonylcarbamoyltransferase complex ATPase subunit type 1 TsaE [Pseudomonadota bacterium]|nr:tRNA (adenosine(37)-N6)-threonylcarbamoyltransferase complex ATPase subunit type 1 TsaE [Pseudomonadota bacterium]